jgi:hypothetical protein
MAPSANQRQPWHSCVCFRFGLFACRFAWCVLSIVLTPKSGEDFSHVAADQHIVDAVDELRAATAAAIVHKKLFGFSPLPMCLNAASVSLPFSSFRLRCRTSRSHLVVVIVVMVVVVADAFLFLFFRGLRIVGRTVDSQFCKCETRFSQAVSRFHHIL